MSKPKAFYSYMENEEKLNMLSDEQAGRLYKSLYAYSRTGEKPDFSDDALLAYAFMDFIIDIDRDQEKYEQTCKKRAEAGKKGGKANQANASFTSEKQANQANASFASNEKAKSSKSSETETEAETEAEAKADINAHALIKKGARPDFDEEAKGVLRLFKEKCPDFVQPDRLTDHRRRLIYQARNDKTDFAALFDKAQASDFLTGRDGGRGGLGIDWVLQEANRQKILEGNYDNRAAPKKGGKGSMYSSAGASFDVKAYESSSMFD